MKKLLCLLVLTSLGSASAQELYRGKAQCLVYKGNTLSLRTACTVSSGMQAGKMYEKLEFSGQSYTAIYTEKKNAKSTDDRDVTLNGKPASAYARDVTTLKIIPSNKRTGLKYFSCVKTRDGQLNVCQYATD